MKPFSPIAIVGIGGIFPGAPTLDAFWQNIEQGVSAAREVPKGRWPLPLETMYNPQRGLIDHVYSKRGCYVTDFALDAAGLNLDPALIAQLDPVFHLALHAARAALQDARLTDAERRSAGVILGNIALPTETMSAMTEEMLGKAFEKAILQPCEVSKTSQGLTTNPLNRHAVGMVAGITAQAFGLGGGSFTVDGACAASLYALNFAVMELQAGRADAMLTGGVCRPDSAFTQMGFCQLGALSPTGACSPFDAKNDGLVVGEGAGVFVLKRLDDAIRDSNTIYAVIRGIGLSNDRQGNLLAPDTEGQLRAMRAAYSAAGWQPQDVDLIECHATGTPVGDAVEFSSLRTLWGDSGWTKNQCVIGGVKSNVGHLLTGAGAAGLMKTVLALKHRILPPTANFATPNPKLDMPNSPFTVLNRAKKWNARNADMPRRAAVSAFGFGGINAHLLLEEYMPTTRPEPVEGRGVPSVVRQAHHERESITETEFIAVVGLETHIGAWESAEAWLRRVFNLETEKTPAPKPEQWGVEQRGELRGYFLDQLELPVGKFKIPPKEMEESLPQQLLMLKAAAAAIEDAKLDLSDAATLRTGVFTGIGLDFNSTNFSYRWKIAERAKTWAQQLGLTLTDNELAAWVAKLRDAFCPPLTANRTVGALGGIVASRIAREFKIGGAGITISAEENSGLQALNAAVRLLQNEMIDQAIVGAVDMHGDIRSRLAAFAENPNIGIPAEGAVAVILKRLDDAKRDGSKIYAVIKGFDSRSTLRVECEPQPLCGKMDAERPNEAIPRGAWNEMYLGAATGLTRFVNACLSLHHQILPPDESGKPQFYLRDRADGLRRMTVNSSSADGNRIRVELEESDAPHISRVQALPSENEETLFAIEADDAPGIVSKINELQRLISESRSAALPLLARRWRESQADSARLGLAAIAADPDELRQQLELAAQTLRSGAGVMPPGSRLFFNADPLGKTGELAFVFPGSGSHYPGMGRDIAARWPDILRKQDADNTHLKSQYLPELFWNAASQAEMDRNPRDILLGQVAYSTMMADLLRSFGLNPQASIGYSLGESSALFALGVWKERDEMLRRIRTSTLYTHDLAGEFRAAAQTWNFPEGAAADWAIAAVQCPAEQVRAALQGRKRVYLLILNTPVSCVIGGDRSAVNETLAALGCAFSFIGGVSAAHCEVVKPVAQAYRAFHFFENATAPEGVRFYSTAWGKAYPVTPDSAADAILAQALDTIDFPAVIRQAHQDGVRVFVEVGPGNSCTNMIGKILENQSHVATSACAANSENLSTLLRLLGRLIAERVPVDLSPLFPLLGGSKGGLSAEITTKKTIRIPMGGKPFNLTPYPSPDSGEGSKGSGIASAKLSDTLKVSDNSNAVSPPGRGKGWVVESGQHLSAANPPLPLPGGDSKETHPSPVPGGEILAQQIAELVADMSAAQRSKSEAHEAYLKLARGLTQSYEQQLAFQMSLIEAAIRGETAVPEGQPPIAPPFMAGETVAPHHPDAEAPGYIPPSFQDERPVSPVFMTREQCMEFAVGKIGKALGERFAEIDAHPTRVRLPDEPLMLVDRILEVEGEPCSMTRGRVVTEHDVLQGAWYLDCGRIPTCIAVESGQADLFLSGYLGIDFITKGLAVYRLLDATVTFHDDLPAAGAVIRHDIHIDEFFRQGDTHLFRFRFESTVEGKLFLTMTKGCAGFFTLRDLEEGKGLVFTEMDLRRMPGKTPPDWQSLTKISGVESYSDAQLDALRRGDLAGCFGAEFAGLALKNPCRLPGGRMKLVDRILTLDPQGGRFGLGQIRGEADIHPDDWFLTCHFSDDQVMPGTLMYECCLHTLRVLLMRMGWVGEQDDIGWQPVPGVGGQLKCRGQVIATTRKVVYEISLKEIGFRPEPYVICDAVMSADGKPIVRMIDMSLRLTGMTREKLREIWIRHPHPSPLPEGEGVLRPSPFGRGVGGEGCKPALFDSASIMAFSNGKPSEAFGERYRIFDAGRVIARLPGPPYQFLDRITAVSGEQWVMAAGKAAEAQYDTPPQEWYFNANRCDDMPFSVLLEIVLQPCGWLAAYVGSALTSDVDLSFRNLGGKATQFLPVTRDVGTLTTNVALTSVSASGGMIIQHYSYRLTNAAGEMLYDGTTYFGFFTKQALANQVGLREVTPYQPTADEQARGERFDFPRTAPFPGDQLRMMDAVDLYVRDGGSYGLGFIRGVKTVNPDEWFFKAHFYQDPVWPGSLGLEAFLQLLKVAAVKRWGWRDGDRFETMVLNKPHEWVYRGQVIPTDRHVTVQAEITALDDAQRFLEAEGFLIVDGRIIYEMKRFTLRIR